MGFDIYGMNPVIKKDSIKPEYPETYPGYPGNYDSDCWLSKEEYEEHVRNWRHKRENDIEYQDLLNKYYDDLHKYETENTGVYFRANVWYWRPVAEFLYEHIEVLDDDDLEGLACNSGHVINETVAKIIGKTIAEMHANGLIEEWVQNKKIAEVMKPKEDCDICEGTGVRTDNPMFGNLEPYEKDGIKGLKCNGCDGEGKRAPWSSHYPYDTQKIVDFGKFASESGGFQIC